MKVMEVMPATSFCSSPLTNQRRVSALVYLPLRVALKV